MGNATEGVFDGLRIASSQLVKSDNPSIASPSSLTGHSLMFGVFDEVYLILHGAGVEITVDPYTLASEAGVVFWSYVYASLIVRTPEAFAYSNGVDPSL